MDFNLAEIQQKLKAPKSQFNEFGKYNYRNCEDILNALKPILADYNAAIVITDDLVLIGNRYYVKATASLVNNLNTLASATAWARETETKKGMDEAQITGSASSYARKYALNGLFAIDDNKDADATNKHGKDEEAKPKAPAKSKPKMDKAQFDFVVTCQKAKNHLGQARYYDVLKQHGFEHCTDVPDAAKEAIVDDLRIAAKKSSQAQAKVDPEPAQEAAGPIICPDDKQEAAAHYCNMICDKRQGCPAWDNQKGE